MKHTDPERHPFTSNASERRRAHHEWEERETMPPPFRLWGGFLLILFGLLAWGILTGGG